MKGEPPKGKQMKDFDGLGKAGADGLCATGKTPKSSIQVPTNTKKNLAFGRKVTGYETVLRTRCGTRKAAAKSGEDGGEHL